MLHGEISNESSPYLLVDAEGFVLKPSEPPTTRWGRLKLSLLNWLGLSPFDWTIDLWGVMVIRLLSTKVNVALFTRLPRERVRFLLDEYDIPYRFLHHLRHPDDVERIATLYDCQKTGLCYSNLGPTGRPTFVKPFNGAEDLRRALRGILLETENTSGDTERS